MVSILSRSGEARVLALSLLVICWLPLAAAGLCSAGEGPDEYEPDDHHYQAKHLPLNQLPQLHNFHDQGDEDWFTLYGSAGKLYCLGTDKGFPPPGDRCNTVFDLYDYVGRKVNDPQDEFANTGVTGYGVHEEIYWICPAEGLYFLRVRQKDPGVFGEDTGYAIFFSDCGAWEDTAKYMDGTVHDSLGNDIVNYTLNLVCDGLSCCKWGPIWAGPGSYTIDGIYPCNYTLAVTASDYEAQSKMFTLDSDGMTLDFILTRLPLVPQQPDLVVSAVSKPPLRPGTHDVTFKSTVKNMGTLAAGESQMGIYLSPEPRYDMGRSVPLGSAPVPDLDVGASATVSSKVKVTIPEDASADSVYYVVVQADWTEDRAGVMQELNENNNDKARRLELRLPDLVVSAVSGPVLRPGTRDVTFKSTVKNRGTLAAGESQLGVYLSPVPFYDLGRSVLLGSTPVPGLGVGASATVSSKVKVTIPADASADSVYYVVVQADWTEDRTGVMQELREDNNVKARKLTVRSK